MAAQTERRFSENDGNIAYGAEIDFNSAYVWRGIVVDRGPVMQPSAWISAHGLSLTAWSNHALTNTYGNARLQTTDLTLTYGLDWRKFKIEPTIETYLHRRTGDIDGSNTLEGSLKLSYEAGRFRVFTIQSFDVLTYRGAYFGEAGLGYEGHVTKKLELALSIHSGWASAKFNDVYIDFDKPAFNFIGAEGSLTCHLKPYLYVRPHFEFSNIVGRRLRTYLSSPTIANVGLAMGFEF